jgi:hypothetical protein
MAYFTSFFTWFYKFLTLEFLVFGRMRLIWTVIINYGNCPVPSSCSQYHSTNAP